MSEPFSDQLEELYVVRQLYFMTWMSPGQCTERIIFMGPDLVGGAERGIPKNRSVILEAIHYWSNQITIMQEIIDNWDYWKANGYMLPQVPDRG